MTGPAVVDGVDIDAVTAAVRTCTAVNDLYSSTTATVASYLPGRLVAGVRIADRTVTIQVRSYWGIPIVEVADQVRLAVASLVGDRTVDLRIADITDPPQHEPPTTAAAVPVIPLDPAGDHIGQDEVVWTTSTGGADVTSSALIIPTAAEIPPSSSTVWLRSTETPTTPSQPHPSSGLELS